MPEKSNVAPPPANPRSSRLWLAGAAVVLIALVAAVLIVWGPSEKPPPLFATAPAIDDPVLLHGVELFQANCAACHGAHGTGDGVAAYLLYPKPRNFSSGTFRLTSSRSGLPTDDDLARTLRRGMPGSAMPSWGHLPDADIAALARAVRYLAVEGRIAQLIARGVGSRDEAARVAHSVLDTGPPIEVPARPPDAEIVLDQGRDLYDQTCAKCHDQDGRGRLKTDMVDSEGVPTFARDFTQGIFKGSATPEAVALRITRGLPGSPMPGMELPAAALWSLVTYVEQMIEPGVEERVLQKQTALIARRVPALPAGPTDPAWEAVGSETLPLMPLWWRNDRIDAMDVRAVHDGVRLAVRLTWRDSTADTTQIMQRMFGDGAAIQFSDSDNPPLFAMGDTGRRVDIWYWRSSLDPRFAPPGDGLAAQYPNMAPSLTYPGMDAEGFHTGAAAGNPMSGPAESRAAEHLYAQGIGTLTMKPPSAQAVEATAERSADDRWAVVFVRNLQTGVEGDVRFSPGETRRIAFAAWDGAAGDRNGQKAVTIWHTLALDE